MAKTPGRHKGGEKPAGQPPAGKARDRLHPGPKEDADNPGISGGPPVVGTVGMQAPRAGGEFPPPPGAPKKPDDP